MRPGFADREYIRRFRHLKKKKMVIQPNIYSRAGGKSHLSGYRGKNSMMLLPRCYAQPLTPRIARGPTDCEHNGVEGARIRERQMCGRPIQAHRLGIHRRTSSSLAQMVGPDCRAR